MRAPAIAFCVSLVAIVSGSPTESALGQSGPDTRPIGKAVIVTGSVTVEHTAPVALLAKLAPAPAELIAGGPLYIGDVVQTGPDSKAGITFSDGTTFNMSGNARIVIDAFVYDPKGKANETVFSLSKGTFTMIAGQVAKTGSMKVDTPVATLGIRGTTPHIEIAEDGTVSVATLIEKGMDRAFKKGGIPIMQKKALIQPRRLQDLDKSIDIRLKICTGC